MTAIGIRLPLAAQSHALDGDFRHCGLRIPVVPQTTHSDESPRVECALAGSTPGPTWVDGRAAYSGLLLLTAVAKTEIEANQLAAQVAAHMAAHTVLSHEGEFVGEITGPARFAGSIWEGDEVRIPITIPLTGY